MGKTQQSLGGRFPWETPPPSPRSTQARAPKQLRARGALITSFAFVMLKASALAAGGAGRFQDLIQHLLVKCWTVIVSLGKARDVQITLAGWFHPPAIGYPIRQNADFHPGCLI